MTTGEGREPGGEGGSGQTPEIIRGQLEGRGTTQENLSNEPSRVPRYYSIGILLLVLAYKVDSAALHTYERGGSLVSQLKQKRQHN